MGSAVCYCVACSPLAVGAFCEGDCTGSTREFFVDGVSPVRLWGQLFLRAQRHLRSLPPTCPPSVLPQMLDTGAGGGVVGGDSKNLLGRLSEGSGRGQGSGRGPARASPDSLKLSRAGAEAWLSGGKSTLPWKEASVSSV